MKSQSQESDAKGASLGGGLWTVSLRVIAQLLQFSIFIVAVRILTPAEFGIFALVAAATMFLTQFAAAGWPEYVMQWTGDSQRPRQTLFVAMTSGVIFMLLGFGCSAFAPRLVSTPEIGTLIRVFSVWIFFAATGAVLAGIMNWQNKLTSAAFAAIGGDIANVMVAIWALLEGYGIFALALGRLSGGIVWTTIGFAVVRMTPCIHVQFATLRSMLHFSSTILVVRLLGNVRIYAGTFIIGGFMGPAPVGYYRAAQRIVGAFGEIVSEPTRVLAWSLFRKTRIAYGGKNDGFNALGKEFFGILLICSIPLFASIALMAQDLTHGVLGPDWDPAVPVVRTLAIANMVTVSSYALEPILSLAGFIKILPRIVALHAVLSILFISLAAPYGIHAVAWAEFGTALTIFAINVWIVRRFAGIRWEQIFYRARTLVPLLLIACLPVILSNYFGFLGGTAPLLRFVGLGLATAVIFIPSMFLIDPGIRSHVVALKRPSR